MNNENLIWKTDKKNCRDPPSQIQSPSGMERGHLYSARFLTSSITLCVSSTLTHFLHIQVVRPVAEASAVWVKDPCSPPLPTSPGPY